jgi:hypothetical protein
MSDSYKKYHDFGENELETENKLSKNLEDFLLFFNTLETEDKIIAKKLIRESNIFN